MLRRQRRAVDLVGEDRLTAEDFVEREAARIRLLLPAFDAPVETGEEHLDGTLVHACLLEQPHQGEHPASGRSPPPRGATAG